MDNLMLEEESELQATKRKWVVYRLTREVYLRLYEKKKRGDKINFRERGNDYMFGTALHAPTGEEIKVFCGEGYFIIEHLFDGTAGDWTFAAIVPSQDVVMPEQSAQSAMPQAITQSNTAPSQPEHSSAQSINATTETIRATKELLKEVAPPTQPPAPASLTKEDVAQMVEQGLLKVVEQMKEAQPKREATPEPMEQILKVTQGLRELGVIREEKERADSDPTETFLNTYERFLDISTRINPDGKTQQGWFEKTMGAVESVANVAPKVLPYIAQFAQMRAGAQAQGESQPANRQQPLQQETPEVACQRVLLVIAEDLCANRRTGRAADLIEESCRRHPSIVPQVVGLLSMEEVQLLGLLSQVTQQDLTVIAHGVEWLGDLKEELSESEVLNAAVEQSPVAEQDHSQQQAVAQNNGNGHQAEFTAKVS